MPKSPPNNDSLAFGQRLVALLERSGQPRRGAGSYLSKKYSVANVTANSWLNGEYRPETDVAKQIAEDHGSSFDELYFGTPSNVTRLRQPVAPRVLRDEDVANVTAVAMSDRLLPLLTYVQCGRPQDEWVDDFAPGAADEYVPIDAVMGRKLGPYAFALRVEGESMLAEFKPGDLVIVDPNMSFGTGDFVVAKIQGKSRATLKMFVDRGVDDRGRDQFDLVPLNKEGHETIRINSSNPGSVIGVVRQRSRNYK